MPAEVQTPPPRQSKGRQRVSKKAHDASAQATQSDIGAHDQGHRQQATHGHSSSQHPPAAGGVPSTTPRKRLGKGEKSHTARNGYHSDTGAYHQNHAAGAYSAHPHGDMDAGHVSVPSTAPVTTTPTKQQVYAGPAFFASPAASALPMPKGFGRPAAAESELTRPSSGSDGSSRSPAPSTAASMARGGSPLDMLFKADRDEKSRKASGNASPLAQMQSVSRNTVRSSPHGRHISTPQGSSSKAMFMAEMDGSGEQSDSDEVLHTVPFKARMQGIAEERSPLGGHTDSEHMQRQAKTNALKQLLMAPPPQIQQHSDPEPPLSAPLHGTFPRDHRPPDQYAHQPHPHQHQQQHLYQPYPQPHPQPQHFQQHSQGGFAHYGPHHGQAHTIRPSAASPSPQDLRSMEENLRKVLKLGPGP